MNRSFGDSRMLKAKLAGCLMSVNTPKGFLGGEGGNYRFRA